MSPLSQHVRREPDLRRFLLGPPRAARRGLRRLTLLAAGVEQRAYAWLARQRRYRAAGPALCLVSHDAYRHGAQILALELARIFARRLGISLHIVLLGPGPLTAAFRRYGRVHVLSGSDTAEAGALAQTLHSAGVRNAICSSVASGLFLEALTRTGVRCVSLVHELPELINERGFRAHAAAVRAHAAVAVFPSDAVRDRFPGGAPANTLIRPQGLARHIGLATAATRAAARDMLLRRFGVPLDAPVVLNAGYGDLRKGVDLFVEIGARVMADEPKARFVWVGAVEPAQAENIRTAINASGAPERFIFAPFTPELAPYFAAADVFALTSREDPFPTVLLQAQDAGLPTVAFAGAGGFDALLANGGGALAPAGDAGAFADQMLALLRTPDRRAAMSQAATETMRNGYNLRTYAFDLAALASAGPPRVSVVVPNHNYARYLPQRLRSILSQTLPIYELIVLDDCSSDDSISVANAALRDTKIEYRVIPGTEKAQSVFAQWRRGVALARGDLVWIAEADDLSDPRFLENVTPTFADAGVVMSFAQSSQIDEAGKRIDGDYLTYLSDVDDQRWRSAYRAEGLEEIRTALAVKNTIPNVSACVFRREALAQTLDTSHEEIERFRIAGDWMTYIRLLSRGSIAYTPRALNHHRRHTRSVTASALSNEAALQEIEIIQTCVAAEFDISARTAQRAAAYRETLRRQFGLSAT